MKYQSVLQHSEEDCGAASLATVAKHYGRTFTLNHTREAVGTGSRGTTLLGLRRGAEALGFHARQVQANQEIFAQLNEIPLPAIIHWKGNHWIVLYGLKRRKYVIADPKTGILYLTHKELTEGWRDGILLLLIPDESRFYEQPNDRVGNFSRYLARVYPYRWLILQAIAINFVIGLLSLASPFMTQILTDDVLVRGDLQLLAVVAIGTMGLNLITMVTNLVQSFLIGNFGQQLQLGLIFEYGHKLFHLPLSYFEGRRSGEVVSRIRDVSTINNLVSQIVLGLPSQFFIAIISFAIMLFYSWQLTIASVLAFAVITGVNLLFLPILRRQTRKQIVLGTETQGFLVETFRGVQVLKTTQATTQAWEEYQTNYGRLANLNWQTMKLQVGSNLVTSTLSSLTSTGVLWLGSYLTINRTLSIGQLLAYSGMSANFLSFLSSVVRLIDKFISAQIVIQRLSEVIDATSEDDNDIKKSWVEISTRADLTFTKLNYHHAGRIDLLEDFSLIIPGGRVTALIGESGCGKSTLAKLIAGLYFPQSGNIRYGRYNQPDISLECLRQQVMLVPQEPHFWSRSIAENFYFSYNHISFDEIVNACEIAGADEFISQLPDRYQTVLGEFGANLSGGQKQRLAIARAIVTNPPVLILDESTGALDPVNEARVLENLLAHRQGKTTILISHRPKVIQRADWIVYLERGRVKATGTPAELHDRAGEHLNFLDDFLVNGNGKKAIAHHNFPTF